MGYEYRESMENFSLTTLNSGGINDGNPYSTTGLSGRKLYIFLNVNSISSGRNWLPLIAGSLAPLSCSIVIIAFNHNGTSYISLNNYAFTHPTAGLFAATGTTAAQFNSIPILMDNIASSEGQFSNYHFSYSGVPVTNRDYCCYLSDSNMRIADKWHNDWSNSPISFKHLLSKNFDPSNYAGTAAYITERINKLSAPLHILASEPETGTVMNSLPAETRIIFSRPVQGGLLTAGNYSLDGEPVPGGPLTAASASQSSSEDKAENAVRIGFASSLLQAAATNHDINLNVSGLTDADDNSITTPDSIQWTEDLSGPVPMLSFAASYSNPTNASNIQVYIDYNESVSNFQSSLIEADNANLTVTAVSGTPGRYLVQLTPTIAEGSIVLRALAAAVQDDVGNPSVASGDFPIAYDAVAPYISGASLDYAAKELTVHFSTAVYGNQSGTAAVAESAFAPSIDAGSGTAPTLSMDAASPGAANVVFSIGHSVTPHGDERIRIAPAVGADIFDAAGNRIDITHDTGWLYFPDQTAPAAPLPAWSNTPGNPPVIGWPAVSGANRYRVSIDGGTSWNEQTATEYTYTAVLAPDDYQFMVTAGDAADNWSLPGELTFTIPDPVTPELPRAISLVLDYSGSMNSQAVFEGISKSRKTWVQEAVSAVFGRLMDHLSDHYSIGMILYAQKALLAMPLTQKTVLMNNPDLFSTALASTAPGSNTAMGKAMAHALSMLDYTQDDDSFGARRAILLLADGQQNVQPKLTFPAGSPASCQINTALAPADCPAGMGTITVDNSQIPVHSCGIGSNSVWLNDLIQLSSISGGLARDNAEIWPNLVNYLTALQPYLYPDSSPQIIRNEAMHYKKSSYITFPVNAGIRRLTICLSWPGSTPLRFSLFNGRTRVRFDKTTEDKGLYITSIDFPHYQLGRSIKDLPIWDESIIKGSLVIHSGVLEKGSAGKGIDPRTVQDSRRIRIHEKGSWRIIVEAGPGSSIPEDYPYNISIIADEKHIKTHFEHSGFQVQSQTELETKVQVLRDGLPFKAKPQLDVLLYSLPENSVPASSAGIRKEMLIDAVSSKNLINHLQGRIRRKDPSIAVRLKKLDTPGLYRVRRCIKVDLGKDGIYERIVDSWTSIQN